MLSPPVVVVVTRDTVLDAAGATALATADSLALGCEGIDLGAPGAKLTQIELGMVDGRTYIFDMVDLGLSQTPAPPALSLLKALLETSGIIKITHDCKAVSDVLYDQFSIMLRHVHDTSAWHSVLCAGDGLHLASLNDTLLAYDCTPIQPRDVSAYANDPLLWARRAITEEMVVWAVQRTEALFQLQAAQNRAATPAKEARCYAESCVNLARFREAFSDVVYIHPTQVGRVVGRGGENIRALEQKTGTFLVVRNVPAPCVVIYAWSRKTLASALNALHAYTAPSPATYASSYPEREWGYAGFEDDQMFAVLE
ncbi:hypothetical protein KFE25_000141 [Diacronema lutheri]|uniref:K Homology domain-containing protein n=1 Tax=Diacronema lutheri TaxID=2081491 RepID=A0A8J6CDX2_DIALT|nr:hypothetical protein KFE25_000141 [Diacronema lutheri]